MRTLLGKTYNTLLQSYIGLQLSYYRFKNRHKPKILFYTDSRGHEITQKRNKHNPFSSYISYFIKNYNCEVYVCEQRFTTIIDFINCYEKSSKNFDFVVSHVGVVDFASRPLPQALDIIKERKSLHQKYFTKESLDKLYGFKGYEVEYEGTKTSAITPELLLEEFANLINKIPSLIWISCNEVDLEWRGNYKRNRPSNSWVIIEKSKQLVKLLTTNKIVDLTTLTKEEVHKYTCDNVHLSEEGMKMVEKRLKDFIEINERNNKKNSSS